MKGMDRIIMLPWQTSYRIPPRDGSELVEKSRIITGLQASTNGMLPSYPEEVYVGSSHPPAPRPSLCSIPRSES